MTAIVSCSAPVFASGATYADKLDASSQMGIVMFAARHGCSFEENRVDRAFAQATLKKLQAAFTGMTKPEIMKWLDSAGMSALYKDLGENADLTCDLYESMKTEWLKAKNGALS